MCPRARRAAGRRSGAGRQRCDGKIHLERLSALQQHLHHGHGPDGIGSTFAPSLIEQPLPFARFEQIVREGSGSGVSVMRGFADDPNVAPYVRDIYRYLEARADGVIGRGRPALEP